MLKIFFIVGTNLLLICDASLNETCTNPSRTKRENSGCKLPSYPQNGHWTIQNGKGSPGEKVAANSILEFKCQENFRLSGDQYLICSDYGWGSATIPQCEQLCPSLVSTTKTITHCYNRNATEIDCNEATSGSFLKYECAPFYEPAPGQKKIMYCMEGRWSQDGPICQPICGEKIDTVAFIGNGRSLQNIVYPWIVALYHKENNNFDYICGGTIVHRKVVLSAAHCVTNDYANIHPVEDYEVVAAKLHSNYSHPNDTDAQYLKLSHIIIHPQYKGESTRFLGDIALLVTQEPFKIDRFIKPVCINDLHNIYLYPGNIGEIAGWGATENSSQSDELKVINIPFKDKAFCIGELPKGWAERYDVIDKICAGSPDKKVSVCVGDSGSGLVFNNIEDDKYYVHGIVSIAPTNGTGVLCNKFTSALYTKVSFYYQFINNVLSSQDKCILPNHPENGKWILKKSSKKVPGNNVSPYDVLDVVCDKGYNLSVSISTMDCETLLLVKPTCKSNLPSDADKCGRKFEVPQTENRFYLEYPWVAHIYDNRSHVALGTLISKRMVISAPNKFSPGFSAATLTVVTRKYYWPYLEYIETVDEYIKFYNVSNVYQNNETLPGMVLLLVEEKIKVDQWVQPICIQGIDSISVQQGDIFQIADYNYPTRPAYPFSSFIAYCDISFKNLWHCSRESGHMEGDPICGISIGSSYCAGRIGAGLMYKNPTNKLYFLIGVKVADSDDSGYNHYYTDIRKYYAVIKEQIEKYDEI